MPKSFLFTHRRYNVSPVPTDEANKSKSSSQVKLLYTPQSPGRGSEAEHPSPGRPQSARISPVKSPKAIHTEDMYNLLQLAEVSLAASGATVEVRSVLERLRSLKSPAKALDVTSVEDKPLDLSRDPSVTSSPSEMRILTPSPSPTPSDTTPVIKSNEESGDEETDSCWSPPCTKSAKTARPSGDGTSDGHECPDCGKRYSTSSNLARHRQTHRSPADQKARRCPHCDKVYVSVPAFSMHVRTHSQGCKCPYCGKAFSRPWLLQGHIRTHTGEKPFSCQICEKAFADKSNLRAHIQTHSNLKPFTCQRCGKAFALKSYLYKHEESSCMKLIVSSGKMSPAKDT